MHSIIKLAVPFSCRYFSTIRGRRKRITVKARERDRQGPEGMFAGPPSFYEHLRVPGECCPPRGSRVKAWLFDHLGEESSTGQAVVRSDRAGFQARMSDGYNPSPSYPVVPPPRCILLVYAPACPALLPPLFYGMFLSHSVIFLTAIIGTHWHWIFFISATRYIFTEVIMGMFIYYLCYCIYRKITRLYIS